MKSKSSKRTMRRMGRGGTMLQDSHRSFLNFMNSVEVPRHKSSTFDLSHPVKSTFDMGYLIPLACIETLPNDYMTIGFEHFARFQALLAPTMDRFDFTQETFYIPYRILWDGWQKFIMSVHDGSEAPACPYFKDLPVPDCGLDDYLGLPKVPDGQTVDKAAAFARAAYNCVVNYWYRNPAVSPEVHYKLTDGENNIANFNAGAAANGLRKKNWNSDLFTRGLPNAQAGAAVQLPLGDFAPVIYEPTPDGSSAFLRTANGSSTVAPGVDYLRYGNGSATPSDNATIRLEDGTTIMDLDPGDTLKADLSQSTAVSVSELRLAFRLQEYAEMTMRVLGGSVGKYVDYMLGFFGADVPDATIQMPEYLGSSSQPMVVNAVTQTSESNETPLGDLAGQGVSIGAGNALSYKCTEHGIILVLGCLRPKTQYFQGMPEMYDRFDPFDYGHPHFAHLSEQPVKNKYVYYNRADGLNEQAFNYQPIYSGYRFLQGRVHGNFRGDMMFWHDARYFGERPLFNKAFVECSPSTRIFAVEDLSGNQVQYQGFCHCKVDRQLPFLGTPIT